MASSHFLLAALLVAALSAPAVTSILSGGFQPVKMDLKDPYLAELGQFAVNEHNQKASDNLVFVKVVSAQQQVVSGTNYLLVIVANAGTVEGKFQALVYDKPWEKVRTLNSFQKL